MAATDLDALLDRQSGVLSLDQALEFFDADLIRRNLGPARRWQAPHRRVVVLHNGPLTEQQRVWVASLAAPKRAALWGGTAAALDGFRDRFADDRIHVVLPAGARRLSVPGVVTHWSAELTEHDIHPTAVPRRTRLPRSVLDLAASARSERRARTVIFAAAQQRLVLAADLDEALARRGPCRHHAVILETIADLDGGIASVPERDFDEILRSRRLPRPSRQSVKQRANGRYYLDALWEAFRLWVEIDGEHHREAQQWEDDLYRTADVVADGLRQLRFTSHAVRRKDPRIGEVLERALRSGGWNGLLAA